MLTICVNQCPKQNMSIDYRSKKALYCVISMIKLTFEGFATYVTAVRTAFLVLAGFVADEGAFLSETLLTDVTAKRTLTSVCPVVFI